MKARPATRAETAVDGVLMAAFMVASPFVAYAAGRWADATLSRKAQAQRAALRQVRVPAPGGAAAGSTVMVWVNRAGELADPPLRQSEIADRTELAQGSAAALFAVGLAVIGRQARRRLDRRRTAA
jgi:hypothetical protein